MAVDAGYGSFRALFDISIDIPRGSAVALVGANGGGKVDRGAGCHRPGRADPGHTVDGEDFTGAPVHHFARAGIAMAPEGRGVFSTLCVADNLRVGFRNTPDDRGPAAGSAG